MNKVTSIRAMEKADLPTIKLIIDQNEMFPSEYLDEMTSEFLAGDSSAYWFVALNEQALPVGIAFCAPEQMTDGTWNLLLIAVSPKYQGKGIGRQLIHHTEALVTNCGARILLIETSGLEQYASTRAFYPKCGYSQVAVIPEYYEKGDDKIVFLKSF